MASVFFLLCLLSLPALLSPSLSTSHPYRSFNHPLPLSAALKGVFPGAAPSASNLNIWGQDQWQIDYDCANQV